MAVTESETETESVIECESETELEPESKSTTETEIECESDPVSVTAFLPFLLTLFVFALLPGCHPDTSRDAPCAQTVWYHDADNDGFGNEDATALGCAPPAGYVDQGGDCDESDASVFPGAIEACNGVDDDCDGEVDEVHEGEVWYVDGDGDGHGAIDGEVVVECDPDGSYVLLGDDCDDADPDVYPGAVDELCDGVDGDCDGDGAAPVAATVAGVEYDTLTEATDALLDGGTMYICPGTHTEQILLPQGIELTVTSWSGDAEDTILDGAQDHTILYVPTGTPVEISNLTFRNGLGEEWLGSFGLAGEKFGGALLLLSDEARISGCHFEGNQAREGGGAVMIASFGFNGTGDCVVTDCTFEGNSSAAGGAIGSLGVESHRIEIRSSSFRRNDAMDDAHLSGYGGAVDLFSWLELDVIVDRSEFEENTALANGGAVEIASHGKLTLAISDSSFTSNHVPPGFHQGGGVTMDVRNEADIRVVDSQFESNQAYLGAGLAIRLWDGLEADITGCFFTGNVGDEGSAMAFVGRDEPNNISIVDTVVDANGNGSGAAILLDEVAWADMYHTVSIEGGAITRNQGGGLMLNEDPRSSLTSTAVDWGSGNSDNDTYDVWTGAEYYLEFGAGEDFECWGSGTCE